MAAKDPNGEVNTHGECADCSTTTNRERSFDELARGLASGTLSRRKALKLMGAALVGGALASVPGVAWAARGGNSACAKFCRENFPPGRERGQCISAGARGEGPCFDGNGGGTVCTAHGDTCVNEFGETGQCCCNPPSGEPTTNCICCFGEGVFCGVDLATGEPVCV
jgi:hypothetical protein